MISQGLWKPITLFSLLLSPVILLLPFSGYAVDIDKNLTDSKLRGTLNLIVDGFNNAYQPEVRIDRIVFKPSNTAAILISIIIHSTSKIIGPR